MSVSAPGLEASGLPQSQVAADQEVLVRYLATRVRGRLSGAAPEMAAIEGQRPSQVLQLGVLPPLLNPGDTLLSPEDFSRERRMPPSNIGLTFVLQPEDDVPSVQLGLE